MRRPQPDSIPSRIIPSPPQGWDGWDALMHRALVNARLASDNGDVPVGALIINANGHILAEGGNTCVQHNNPAGHAEINVLMAAGNTLANYRLNGCVLVVTLEPCLMCAAACAHARLAGVVYGARDTKAGAVESCTEALEVPFLNHRPWHMGGVLEQECSEILATFFALRR